MSDDYAATTQTTGAVAVGGSATGEIETAGDHDWFAVTLEAGKTYLRGIHDANGNFLSGTTDNDCGAGKNSRVYFTATEDATYYVAAGANGSDTGTYTLFVTDVTDDYAAGTGTSGAVAVGGSTTGRIETTEDHDWFAVELAAGMTYRIDQEGSRTGSGTLSDPYLRGVHDANGNFLSGTTNDNGGVGLNSRLEFTATENATYYVAAGAPYYVPYVPRPPSQDSNKGTYTLSVTELGEAADDYAAGTGTGGAIVVGGSATGEIDYARDRDWFAVTLEAGKTYRIDLEGSRTGEIDYARDRDWFKVTLEAGTTYRIDLEGSPSGSGTLRDPYLRGVHDSNGDLIAGTTDDDGGEGDNSRVDFTATADAEYYVAAGARGSHTGTYTLSVEEVM